MTRTYVVTGSSAGLGAATADLLRSQGHRVIGVDLRDADVRADLATDRGRRAAVVGALLAVKGPIDGIVAAAALEAGVGLAVSLNYFGAVRVLEGLRTSLALSREPRAVVISGVDAVHGHHPALVEACLLGDETRARSVADSLEAQGPAAGYLNQLSAKVALSRWVRRTAITPAWAGAGIALNAVAPGTIRTEMSAPLLDMPDVATAIDAAVPMPFGGHARPESLAPLLAWLVSAENAHVTGQTICADGGAEAVLRHDRAWP